MDNVLHFAKKIWGGGSRSFCKLYGVTSSQILISSIVTPLWSTSSTYKWPIHWPIKKLFENQDHGINSSWGHALRIINQSRSLHRWIKTGSDHYHFLSFNDRLIAKLPSKTHDSVLESICVSLRYMIDSMPIKEEWGLTLPLLGSNAIKDPNDAVVGYTGLRGISHSSS